MKKNFFYNSARFSWLLLPVMLFLSASLFAGENPTPRKTSMVALAPTAAPTVTVTNTSTCANNNGSVRFTFADAAPNVNGFRIRARVARGGAVGAATATTVFDQTVTFDAGVTANNYAFNVTGLSTSFLVNGYSSRFEITDLNGVTLSGPFTPAVFIGSNDATAPTANAISGTLTVNAAAGTCTATVTAAMIATSSDNCSVVNAVIDGGTPGIFMSATSSLNLVASPNPYTITYWAQDGAGNTSAPVTRQVIVKDVTAPTFTAFAVSGTPSAINGTAGLWLGGSGACGSTFIASQALACSGLLAPPTHPFPSPAVADICPGALTYEVSLDGGPFAATTAGAATGIPAGRHTIIYRATDAGGNITTCTYTLDVPQLSGALVCVGNYNVSLTACTQQLAVNDLVQSASLLQYCGVPNLVVELYRNGRWVSGPTAANISSNDAGVAGLQYRVRDVVTGVACWGNLFVEDKQPPVITNCPANFVAACENAALVYNLAESGDFLPGGNNNGTVNECSTIEQRYSDVRVDYPCGAGAPAPINPGTIVIAQITRTWTLKDKFGNISAPCVQTIQIVRAATPLIAVESGAISCALVSKEMVAGVNYQHRPFFDNGAGANAGNGVRNDDESYVTLDASTSCGVFARLARVQELAVCGGGIKYTKTWEIVDMCAGGSMIIDTLTQLVTWQDVTRPTGSISVDNYTLQAGTPYCFTMTGMPTMNNLPTVSRVFSRTTQAFGNGLDGDGRPTFDADGLPINAITVNALADQVTCLAGNVRFSLSNLDGTNCTGFTGAPTVTVSDSRLSLSNGVWSGMFMFGNHDEIQTFTVTLTDACGNQRVQTVRVRYVDNAAPNAICKQATITIPAGSISARLNVNAINNSSTDNCGIKSIMMRKMTSATAPAQTGTTNCYSDVLDYGCNELGSQMVALRIVDYNDNVTECMVNIQVDIKPSVSCTSLPTVNSTCTSNDLLNFRALYGNINETVTSSHPDCITTTAVLLADPDLTIGCSGNVVTRTWRARATVNGVTYESGVCSQTINVTPVRGFRLTTQGDSTYACIAPTASGIVGSAQWIENEKDKTIRALNLLDCNNNKTCAAPVVEVETWEFRSNQYCKIFRVRYTIVDQCVRPIPAYQAPIWGLSVPGCTVLTDRAAVIQDRVNAIVYERLIYIDDRTAPTSTPPANLAICDGSAADRDAAACTFGFSVNLTGSDDCGAGTATSTPGVLQYMWRLLDASGAEISNGVTTNVARNGLAFGTYTIVYRITDLCGNMSAEYRTTITGRDCKAPEIRVHDKVVALAGTQGGGNGMGRIVYADIKNAIVDECDRTLTAETNKIFMERATNADGSAIAPPASPQTSGPAGFTAFNGATGIMFTCADLAPTANEREHKVRVWTNDASGNWNYAVTTIKVQDNDRICAARAGQIAGLISNEANTFVDDVTTTARVAGTVVSTSATSTVGAFNLTAALGSNVQVSASKNSETDAREGVSTADIAAISRHILGSQPLASAYSIIAADVDKNGSVEAADMLQIRRFVLFISPSLPAGSFRFVDKAYSFRNAAEPLAEDFPEVINVANIQGNVAANFVAVHLGDVNNSYRNVTARSSRTLALTANDMDVVAGNEYTVNVSAANFDATAFQGTFSFNGLTVKSIKAGGLTSDANFGQFNNAVTASWNGKAVANADVVAITFVASKSGKLSEMMSFGSEMTKAEAVASNGENMNVTLKFNNGKVSGAEFALYQNTPNPVATSTKVGFNLPKDGAARFTVFNAEGKVLFAKNGDYKAGYNEVILNKSELAAGVLYYRLETADHSATKKMIIIE
jgi:hypothetical protein